MKILVTGANGMLGTSLCPIFANGGHEVKATDIVTQDYTVEYLDVTDRESVWNQVSEFHPDMVVHLAAETDVDRCELDPRRAYNTNTMGTLNVTLACQRAAIPMGYVSTIGVFYGDKLEPYTEFDTPNPINLYGHSKLAGESVVQQLLDRFYIVRAGWMMGGGPQKDKKFVGKMVGLMRQNNEVRVVNDKYGSMTYAVDFSKCVLKLFESGVYGMYHCTNRDHASRYVIALKIAELLGAKVRVTPVSSASFPLPARRARSEMSLNYKLDLLGMDTMRNWEEALLDYISTNWKE